MARLFIDGFESGGLDAWDVININTTQPRAVSSLYKSGAYSLEVNPFNYNNIWVQKNISPSTPSTVYFKAYIRFPSSGSVTYNREVLWVGNSGGAQLCLCLNGSAHLEVRKTNRSGTSLAVGTATISTDTWYLIEGKFVIDPSVGVAQIKCNSTLDINYSGSTHNQSADTITYITLGNPSGGYIVNYDDFVVDDAAWIGTTYIQGLALTGAGASTQWTPSSGSNYAVLNEIPANDSNYVTTNVNGNIDLYTLASLVGSVGAILCLQIEGRCAIDGTPTPTGVELGLRTNGNNYWGVKISTTSTLKGFTQIYALNPDTGVAWTSTLINSLQIGIQAVA